MEELINFSGGLNLDDDILPDGDYRDANNIQIVDNFKSTAGQDGTLKSIKAFDLTELGASIDISLLVSEDFYLGVGIGQVVPNFTVERVYPDNEDENTVYLFCRTFKVAPPTYFFNLIIQYNVTTDAFTKLISVVDNQIGTPRYVKVLGQNVYFIGQNDTVICLRKNQSLGFITSANFVRDNISLHALAPYQAPTITVTETEFSQVFSERSWQFAFRVIYDDGRISTLSPFSNPVGNQEADDGSVTNISAVSVAFNSTPAGSLVYFNRVEVYVRETDIGVWRRCHTSTSTSGSFTWTGQRFEALETNYANSLFNFAPFFAKTLEVMDNRLFIGNGRFFNDDQAGKLSISLASGDGVTFASGDALSYLEEDVSTLSKRPFINNSTYRIGVILKDRYGRTRGVEDDVEFFTGDFTYPVIPEITISASGTLPSWAYAYEVVVTESLDKSYFYEGLATAVYFQGNENGIFYFTRDNQETLVVDLSDMFNANFAYTFQEGDEIRGKLGGSEIIKTQILGQDGSKLFCRNVKGTAYVDDPSVNYDKLWIEIYSPKDQVDTLVYYGIGVTGLTSGLPDTINIDGDAFLRTNNISFTTGTYLTQLSSRVSVDSFSASGIDVVEFNTLDFFNSNINGINANLNKGDNSGFFVEEASLIRFNAEVTVSNYTGTATIAVIDRDPTDNSIASGELSGAKTITLSNFLSPAGELLNISEGISGNKPMADSVLVKIDTSNAILFYYDDDDVALKGQLLSIGSMVSLNGSPYTIATSSSIGYQKDYRELSACLIDSTHVLVSWSEQVIRVGKVQMLDINTSTGVISDSGTELIFNGDSTEQISLKLIDTSNALLTYGVSLAQPKVQLLTLNTGTGAVTLNGSTYTPPGSVNSLDIRYNKVESYVISTTRAVISYTNNSVNNLSSAVLMLTLNTGTGTITATGSEYEFDSGTVGSMSLLFIDSSNGMVIYDKAGGDLTGLLLSTNTGTGAITANGSATTILPKAGANYISADRSGNNVVISAQLYSRPSRTFKIGVEINTGTPSITFKESYLLQSNADGRSSVAFIDTSKSLVAWSGASVSGQQGYSRLFNVGSSSGTYTLTGEIATTEARNICLVVDATTISISSASLELGYSSDFLADSVTGENVKGSFSGGVPQNLKIALRAVNLSSRSTFWRKGLGKPYVELEGVKWNQYLTNRIYYGQRFITDSDINPSNYFYFTDAQDIPFELGSVNALVNSTDRNAGTGTLLAICALRTASIYVGANLISNVDGGTTLVASDRVINGVNILRGDYGISSSINDSFTIQVNDGIVYWFDRNSGGSVCRYTNEGIVRISDAKVKSFFHKVQNSIVNSFYDKTLDYYIISFNSRFICWDNKKVRWDTFLTNNYKLSNCFNLLGESNLIDANNLGQSFRNFVTGKRTVDRACDITLSKHTVRPIEPKYIGMGVRGVSYNAARNQPTNTGLSVVVTNERGQQSTLTNYDFILEDDYIYADVMRDENSSGGKLSGDELVGSKTDVKINIPAGVRVPVVLIGYEPSRGHF